MSFCRAVNPFVRRIPTHAVLTSIVGHTHFIFSSTAIAPSYLLHRVCIRTALSTLKWVVVLTTTSLSMSAFEAHTLTHTLRGEWFDVWNVASLNCVLFLILCSLVCSLFLLYFRFLHFCRWNTFQNFILWMWWLENDWASQNKIYIRNIYTHRQGNVPLQIQ